MVDNLFWDSKASPLNLSIRVLCNDIVFVQKQCREFSWTWVFSDICVSVVVSNFEIRFSLRLWRTCGVPTLGSRLICTSLNRRVGDTWVFVTKEDERQIVHWFSQRKSSLFEMEFQRASGHPHSHELMDAIWVWPPHSNSDHQDYYIFSRGSL